MEKYSSSDKTELAQRVENEADLAVSAKSTYAQLEMELSD
jgi:hypothetical protein